MLPFLNRFHYLVILLVVFVQSSKAQSLSFDWQMDKSVNQINAGCLQKIKISIINGNDMNNVVYQETQSVSINQDRLVHLNIGKGKVILGNIDSVIWAEGVFKLDITADTMISQCGLLNYRGTIRIPTEIKSTNLEGYVDEKSLTEPGHIHIPIIQHKRPKKISVDLSTSYVNLGYPANTYPVYRHYEWFDIDGDGKGNAFSLTYSDNTTHAYKENTNQLGEVRLYEQGAFQQLTISTSEAAVDIHISKPVPVDSFSNTFAIKGPWKITYYVEW